MKLGNQKIRKKKVESSKSVILGRKIHKKFHKAISITMTSRRVKDKKAYR